MLFRPNKTTAAIGLLRRDKFRMILLIFQGLIVHGYFIRDRQVYNATKSLGFIGLNLFPGLQQRDIFFSVT